MGAHGFEGFARRWRRFPVVATALAALVALAVPLGAVVTVAAPAQAAGVVAPVPAASPALGPTSTLLTGQAETATDRIIPLPGIDVRVYDAVTGALAAKRVTNASGQYSIATLPAGTYRVRFSDPGGTYGLTWSPAAATQTGASVVSVALGSPASAVGLMYRTGQIGGTVSGPGGGLSGIAVRLYDANSGAVLAKTTTVAGGTYSFPALPQGAYGRMYYRIRFSDPGGTYATQWDNGVATFDAAQVLIIDVRAGTSPGPVNATLSPMGALSGRLTDGTTGLAGVSVLVYDPAGVRVAKVATDSSGRYTVTGLPVASYTLAFGDQTGAWLPVWFHDATGRATAQRVAVTAGTTAAVADQVMAPAVHLNLTVNSALDAPDAHPGDGVCDDGTGHCTLRAAVDEANANPASDTITIAPGVDPTLTRAGAAEDANATGDLDSRGALVIHGGGATLNAGGLDRAIEQLSGPLTIDHLTITGGTTAGDHVAGQGDDGGAILALSDLTLTDCTIEGNHAVRSQNGRGGGVAVLGSLTMVGTTVTSNTSMDLGGGVWVQGASTVVTDSTISDNQADMHLADANGNNSGSGLDVGSREEHAGSAVITGTTVSGNVSVLNGLSASGGGMTLAVTTARVVDSTVTANAANVFPGDEAFTGGGAGISGDAGPFALVDDTVADNTGYPGVDQLLPGGGAGPFTLTGTIVVGAMPVCNGAWVSLGWNLFSDDSCETPVANVTDRQVTSPGLGPLAANGGPTQTLLPLAGSPAIDAVPIGIAGVCDGSVATDQRGVSRPQGGGCDIGAVEVAAAS